MLRLLALAQLLLSTRRNLMTKGGAEPTAFSSLPPLPPLKKEEIERYDMKKSKSSAGYAPCPPGGFRCDNCIFWLGLQKGSKDRGKCSKVLGDIRPQDCCNFFWHESYGEAEKEQMKEDK